MGIDLLDVSYRINKVFTVSPGPAEYDRLISKHDPPDFTAGEYYECVCEMLTAAGKPIPPSGWHRMKLLLSNALGVNPSEVKKAAFLVRDLGLS